MTITGSKSKLTPSLKDLVVMREPYCSQFSRVNRRTLLNFTNPLQAGCGGWCKDGTQGESQKSVRKEKKGSEHPLPQQQQQPTLEL